MATAQRALAQVGWQPSQPRNISRECAEAGIHSPRTEAQGLLPLLKTNSVQDIRNLIGTHRRDVLLAFDALCIRRGQPAHITAELRAAILDLLQQNYSWKRVAATLRVGLVIVKRCATPAHASTWKIGRGRRFTPEIVQHIKAAIRTEKTSRAVERKFFIDNRTVKQFRREMGLTEDLRYRKKLSAGQLNEARDLLANGARWRDVAERFGVVATTLLANLKYRKRASYRLFTRQERNQILQAVARGEGKRHIAERLKRPRSSIYWLLSREARKARP